MIYSSGANPYFVVGGILWGCGGGIAAFMSAISNYVTDTTPEETRTEKLSKIFPFIKEYLCICEKGAFCIMYREVTLTK